ncbi:MAG TPA: DUF2630 family protein [Nitrospiria bacterium]|nr:DUF2630 family protein [Nitrospiria bacterium]
MEDIKVLHHIKKLVETEEALYSKNNLDEKDKQRLRHLEVELDQCWDLLRQRRALRDVGGNPDEASIRPPKIVENYEQ